MENKTQSDGVRGTNSEWWLLIGDQELLGSILFNAFINDMGHGTECMARKFVGNAILEGKVGSLVNTAAVQRDWTKLEKRAEKNLKKVSKGKCRGVHLE